MTKKLLVIDTSYAYEAIRERKLEDSVTCRDLGGFFEHVYTVHPFASLVANNGTTKFGRPELHTLGGAHTFIDGKMGRFAGLSGLPPLNFVASQADVLARLVRLVRKENISAIRAGDPLYNGLLGLLLARTCNIPLLIRVNANYDKIHEATKKPMMPRFFRSYALEKKIVRFVLSRTDLVAAVNPDNLEFAVANGARRELCTVFRYGNLLDKRHVAPPETRDLSGAVVRDLGIEPGRFLLHVGRLERLKFPEDPIRVLAEVKKRGHEGLKLLMVGDGHYRGELEQMAKDLGIANEVVFAGNRDQDWLSRVIPIAAVVLSPLTGRALSECAFGAAPIVAYDLDWQGELVRQGETGELVPSRAIEAMAASVDRFLRDPEYARRMGRAVREKAFDLLDPVRLDAHERKMYGELLERHAQRL